MLNRQELHEKILYSVVRVRAEKAGGSGTIIYSQPDPKNPEEYLNFALTCEHVVDDCITTRDDWDSLLKKQIKKEFTKQVLVEVFDYVYLSQINSINSHKAEIVAYDKHKDVALLRVLTPKKFNYTATIIPKDQINSIKLFTDAYACGCSLGHEPFANWGQITFLREDIDNQPYLMTNCSSIFGNSGGALFLAENGCQIGISARITGLQLGFGVDIITWMGFAIHPETIYKFFEEQELKFLYDPSDTYWDALQRRKEKQEKALMTMRDEKSD
jgi:hypothetical protein